MLNQLFAFYFHIIIETNNTCMHRIDVYIHLNMHWQIDRLKPMNKICFFFSIIILFVLLLFFLALAWSIVTCCGKRKRTSLPLSNGVSYEINHIITTVTNENAQLHLKCRQFDRKNGTKQPRGDSCFKWQRRHFGSGWIDYRLNGFVQFDSLLESASFSIYMKDLAR